MGNLLIVGNGFDISMEWETQYSQFYNFLNFFIKTSNINEIKTKYADDQLAIETYNLVHNQYKDNFFLNYFLLLNQKLKTWVNFEEELLSIINAFDRLFSIIDFKNNVIEEDEDTGRYIFCIQFDGNIVDIANVFIVYKDSKYCSVAQKDIHNKSFLTFDFIEYDMTNVEVVYRQLENIKKEIPIKLFNDLKDFSSLFINFLKISNRNKEVNSKFNLCSECDYVLNFNYTDSLEKLYASQNKKIERFCYINGKVSNESIVFGVDSNVEFSNNFFNCFKKNYQRTILNTDIGLLNDLCNQYIYSVLIFGHSLCDSDMETLSFLLNNLVLIGDKKRYFPHIYVFYISDDEKTKLAVNLAKILNNTGEDNFFLLQRIGKITFLKCEEAFSK